VRHRLKGKKREVEMKRGVLALVLVLGASGCTTAFLEQYCLNQIASVSDLRYREVLKNLAILAANPSILPSFAVIADGQAQIIDQGNFDAKSVWGHAFKGFISETLTGTASRTPQPMWTLEPVADESLIKAQWCALLWGLYGPPPPESDWADVLREYQWDRELAKLPPGWLHVGCCKDVPKNACYQAHCHNTYVWVTPDGMAGLSTLTLVLLDIATINLAALLEPSVPKATVVHEEERKDSKVRTEYSLDACLQNDGKIKVGNIVCFTQPDLQKPPDYELQVPPQPSALQYRSRRQFRPEFRTTSSAVMQSGLQ
jgi:hypothetical protein